MSIESIKRNSIKKLLPATLALSLAAAPVSSMAQTASSMAQEQDPGMLAIYSDLLLLRPVGLVTSVIGVAGYVLALPFSLPTGTSGHVGKVLVVDPVNFTFNRCLGCTRIGRKESPEANSAKAE